jgi:hypothetical protein
MNMTKPSFFKQNFSLVVGVALPVLLVLFFWLATVVPRILVEPPQHNLIFTSDHYDYNAQVNGTVRFDVKGGQLRAFFHEGDTQGYRQVPRLFYFNVKTESTREIALDIPEDLKDGSAIGIPDLENHEFSNESRSPDGYSFDNSYRGRHGLIFGGSSYRYHAKIEKDGRAIKIPMPGRSSTYDNLRFLGWDLGGE